MTAATLSGEDSSLASQCLALCQKLVSQGKAFTFSLKIDSNSTLSFSLDTKEGKASAVSPEALTRKKVSPSTKRRNARRRAEFQKKKQSSTEQMADKPFGVFISVTTPQQAATSEKPNSSPPRETSQPPPFKFNGGFVYCEKCPVGVLSLDALCLDPYNCADECGLSHNHRKHNGDDVVWAFRGRDTGNEILYCLGSCPTPPGCPCCRVWLP